MGVAYFWLPTEWWWAIRHIGLSDPGEITEYSRAGSTEVQGK